MNRATWLAGGLTLAIGGFLACNGQSTPPASPPPISPPPISPPPASPPMPPSTLEFAPSTLTAASGLNAAPLDVPRTLRIPKGFKISVYARLPKARFMRLAPNGDLLVSQPVDINSSSPDLEGKIYMVRGSSSGGNATVSTFAAGLRKPHDMAFKTIGGTTYLYFSESNQISRAVYNSGDLTIGAKEVVIANLLDASSGELKGNYGHALKNFVIAGDKLYLSIASATNASPADQAATPKRGAIYQYNLDGTGGRLYAQGIRNTEGLELDPSGALWVAVNNRDNIPYPPGHAKEGVVDAGYVDNHPPEELTRVRDGGNYGWPFCNPNPDAGMTNMPFERDWDNNKDGSKLDCAKADRISIGIQAHSAPLGLSYIKTQRLEGLVTPLHGSWNRTVKTGYKVAYFPWISGAPAAQVDLVSGFLEGGNAWGRPVDAISDGAQGLFLSDDAAGAIYHLEPI